MNRIICDICGSEYPENEERCPICSYPRQGNEKTVAAAAEVSRTKVKGGRFSSKNVKKRRKAQMRAEIVETEKDPNKPLIITIAILLIAITLVTAYIALRFFRGGNSYQPILQTNAPAASTTASTPVSTVPPTIPCSGILLEAQVMDLENPGEQKQLSVQFQPSDTTDTVTYVSQDPSVAEVSETGLITAVGSGQTTVTITCGAISKNCTVVCWFQEETTLPPETTAPEATEPKETESEEEVQTGLTLDLTDVSLFRVGEPFTLSVKLNGTTISRSKIIWSTSDSNVATVENGHVVAVGKGMATITAAYEGWKATCIVRCQFENPTSGGTEQEEQDGQQNPSWRASHTDVSIDVGESFNLTIKNGAGETADAVWTMSVDGIVSVSGKTITGQIPGTVTLKTEVDGTTFSCIVRVK